MSSGITRRVLIDSFYISVLAIIHLNRHERFFEFVLNEKRIFVVSLKDASGPQQIIRFDTHPRYGSGAYDMKFLIIEFFDLLSISRL